MRDTIRAEVTWIHYIDRERLAVLTTTTETTATTCFHENVLRRTISSAYLLFPIRRNFGNDNGVAGGSVASTPGIDSAASTAVHRLRCIDFSASNPGGR